MRQLINRIYRYIKIDLDYLFLPYPLQTKIVTICRTNIAVIKNIITKKDQGNITIHNQVITYETVFATKTFLAACYDFYVTTQKLTIFSKNPVILDIGANIGQFAFAVKSFYPDASLYSVEPDVDIFAILKKNFSHSKNMKLFNVAIASNNNSRTFYKSKKFSEWSTLETPKDHENYITTKVDTTTGDTLFKELLNIDLLKIDVEGAEREAIVGMSKTLSKAKYVLIEVSLQRDPIDKNTSLLLKHLLQSGFSLFRIGRIFTYASGQEQGAADLLFKNKLLKK